MGQLLLALMDRAIACSGREIQDHRSQEGVHRHSDPVGVSVSVLTHLHVPHTLPLVCNAPALTHQTQQCFWSCAQAREEVVGLLDPLALARHGGDHLHDPADSRASSP